MTTAAALRAVVVLTAVVATGCGGDDGGDAVGPLLGEIGPAIDAVEAELGGPQEYFEIFADVDKVSLWVATDGATMAVPYVWAAEELSEIHDGGGAASGETFTAGEALTFDVDVLDTVIDDLGDNVTQFSIIGGEGEIVRFAALVESDRGGILEVVVDADGTILESGPL